MKVLDLTGRRFERWTVVERDTSSQRKEHSARWLCRCDCGTMRCVRTDNLVTGRSRSCGCLHDEVASSVHTTHGYRTSPEYKAWQNMMQRCSNPNNAGYENYGGRGISVCAQWQRSFAQFLADMGAKPLPDDTLERRDNDRGYGPQNCYWASRLVQSNNKRNVALITCDGRTQTPADWARETGVPRGTIRNRLRCGWSVRDALFVPPVRGRNQFARRPN